MRNTDATDGHCGSGKAGMRSMKPGDLPDLFKPVGHADTGPGRKL